VRVLWAAAEGLFVLSFDSLLFDGQRRADGQQQPAAMGRTVLERCFRARM